MDMEKVKLQLATVLAGQRVPSLDVLDYPSAHERFAYVTVRDTLHGLGVSFVKAERLASTNQGPAYKRLMACIRELR